MVPVHSPGTAPVIPLYICLGGGLGALGRFALGGWVTTWAGVGFPWGTFAINVLGSALLGFLNRALPPSTSSHTRAFFTIGLCGGFTTFSTFDYETLVLLQQGRYLLAAVYSTSSVLTCVGGVVGGLWLAAWWLRRAPRLRHGPRPPSA
jgi:fluoride exporter